MKNNRTVSMEQYKLFILVLLLISMVTNTTAQEQSKVKDPPGDTLNVALGGTSKISYTVEMNETGYDLYAGLNTSVFNTEGNKQNLLQVVYNSCTDSDRPEIICKEAQVTVRGQPRIKGSSISFYLYGMFDESTYQWGVQRKLATTAIVLSASTTGSGPASGNHGIRKDDSDIGVTVGGYALAGGIVLVMLVAGVITVVVVCKRKNNSRNSGHNGTV